MCIKILNIWKMVYLLIRKNRLINGAYTYMIEKNVLG